jgi:SHS2 domain-containing protein
MTVLKNIEYLNHTSDIRLKLKADTIIELFEAGLTGMNEILKAGECDQPQIPVLKKMIHIKAQDITSLLIEFLGEILTLSHTSKAIFCTLYAEKLTDREIIGYVWGADVPVFDQDIKAVTYHEVDVKRNPEGQFETSIVFDT